ncbi:hypothetical protein WMZ97_21945 [Lentibacillus sp. N15]|uniref:hypothetical protein n=1 Tax=Lentibacillus songyuanensis TaxID=3136161 RepID=UPI0031BA87DB
MKSARNAFIFYAVALFVWGTYDFIDTGNANLQLTIFTIGVLIFSWSRIVLDKQTETEEKKVQIPSKTILWTVFYFVLFLVIMLIVSFFF